MVITYQHYIGVIKNTNDLIYIVLEGKVDNQHTSCSVTCVVSPGQLEVHQLSGHTNIEC